MWLTTRSKLLSFGGLVPDDAADRCTGASAQQAATTDDIAGNAPDDSACSSASLLMRHVGATAQNDQGCCCDHADRIVTYRFHFAPFMLKNWLKGNQRRIFALLLEAHFIADAAHTLDAASYLDGAVHLGLVIDETTELNDSLARDSSNVQTLDVGVGQQRRLDLGCHNGVINLVANGCWRALQTHFVVDALDALNRVYDHERALSLIHISEPTNRQK